MLTMSVTTIASAQEDAPAGPSASDLFKRFDEINARIATLEAAMKDAAGKEDVGQMSGQMDAAKAELEALKAELAQMAARLEAVEATVAGSEDMEGAFDIVLSGYLRTIYTQINDAEDQTSFVGLNDGFAQVNESAAKAPPKVNDRSAVTPIFSSSMVSGANPLVSSL